MNGAVLDTTFNFFFKFKYAHTFDAMLATPLAVARRRVGEMTWALLRGALYSAAFLVTMAIVGLVHSWWAVLALPAAAADRRSRSPARASPAPRSCGRGSTSTT